MSSGNGIEYVHIEFESINAVRSVLAAGQRHFAGRTSLAVKQPLRPAAVTCKMEPISNDQRQTPLTSSHSSVDIAQYSSLSTKHRANAVAEELKRSHRCRDNGHIHCSCQPGVSASIDGELDHYGSEEQLKSVDDEYGVMIRQDFEEITYQVDAFRRSQKQSYRKLRQWFVDELRLLSPSSSDEEGEIRSVSSLPVSKSRARHYRKRARLSLH